MSPEAAVFFLKKGDGAVYGPVELGTLADWARQGRVAPDDSISRNRLTWHPAPSLPDLEMHWMVALDDGSHYGPVHILALQELLGDGSLTRDTLVTNRVTEDSLTLHKALAETLSNAETAGAQEPAASAPAADASAAVVESAPAGHASSDKPPESVKQKNWREMALRNDTSEKEALKWKTLYEDERARNRKKEQDLSARSEELRKSESAARMQLEVAERKVRAAEETMHLLRKGAGSDGADAKATRTMPLIEAYNELSQRYDRLVQQLAEKSAEIQDLLESRRLAEEHAEEQTESVREIARRDREEADAARRRLADIEQDHMHLVKSYRELNDRYIRSRQESLNA